MKHSEIIFGILRIPVDAIAAAAALLLAYWLRAENLDLVPLLHLLTNAPTLPPFPYYVTHFVLGAIGAYLGLLAVFGLYGLKTTLGPWREMQRVLFAAGMWLALVIAWFFLVQKQLFFSRALLLQATIFIVVCTAVGRTLMLVVQRMFLRRGIGVRMVLSCGRNPLPASVITSLHEDIRYKYLGHVRESRETVSLMENTSLDLVLHTDPNPENEETTRLIEWCRNHHVGYAFLPPIFADVPQQLSVAHLGLTPMLRFEPTPLDGWGRVWKRSLDLLFGTLFLLALSPLLLILAAIIVVTSGFPVFYVSHRIGLRGKMNIPLLKFRTMCVDADTQKDRLTSLSHRKDGPLFKVKNDPRITPFGHFLRRWSLDELPQLLNVVLGHLSLVGPRPHLPQEVARYTEQQLRVFTVRPGVTGLAQISGRSDLSFQEEVLLDMRYIEDWSLGLDLWILWRTLFVVLGGKGAD